MPLPVGGIGELQNDDAQTGNVNDRRANRHLDDGGKS
jgi:hypothetical protein